MWTPGAMTRCVSGSCACALPGRCPKRRGHWHIWEWRPVRGGCSLRIQVVVLSTSPLYSEVVIANAGGMDVGLWITLIHHSESNSRSGNFLSIGGGKLSQPICKFLYYPIDHHVYKKFDPYPPTHPLLKASKHVEPILEYLPPISLIPTHSPTLISH